MSLADAVAATAVSSLVVAEPLVATGTSFTEVTLMTRVRGVEVLTFGAAPLPLSIARTSKVAEPKALAAAV